MNFSIPDYKERLVKFNSTEKYFAELVFLRKLLEPASGDRILDYGCGTGTCIRFISQDGCHVKGFDTVRYLEDPDSRLYMEEAEKFNKIYFLHSIAHIPDLPEVLVNLKTLHLERGGKIFVITPNREFDDLFRLKRTDPVHTDPTVQKHFSLAELEELFVQSGFHVISKGSFGKMEQDIPERIFMVAQSNN